MKYETCKKAVEDESGVLNVVDYRAANSKPNSQRKTRSLRR